MDAQAHAIVRPMAARAVASFRLRSLLLTTCAASAAAAAALGGACQTFNGLGLPAEATDAASEAASDAPRDAPGPTFTSYLSLSQGAALCSLLFECPGLAASIAESIGLVLVPTTTELSYAFCVNAVAGPVEADRIGLAMQRAMLTQIAGATSCSDALGAAYTYEIFDSGVSCPSSACVNGVPTACDATGVVYVTNCDSALYLEAGATCKTIALGDAGAYAFCNQTTACGRGATCAGTVASLCDDRIGLAFLYDCAATGRRCETAGTSVRCADLCAGGAAPAFACSGSSIRYCAGPVQSAYDCAAIGRACTTTTTGVPLCTASTDACTPLDVDVSQCAASGASISLCVAGQRTSFDCSSIGQSCRPGGTGQTAHCGP